MNTLAMKFMQFCALALTIAPCKGTPALFTEESTGSGVRLRVGECLQVALRGNATTGFSWEIAHPGDGVLTMQGEPEFAADRGSVGAGGVYTFTFLAVAAGRAPLKLVYRRPWEKEMAPLKTYQLQVTVTD